MNLRTLIGARGLAFVAAWLAFAAPAAAKTHVPKVMVLDLTHDASIGTAAASTLDGFLAGAVRDQGFSVITPAQVGAVLGVERQRQLLGCAESSCLAEIGGALGVDFIVQGSIAQFSKSSAITLSLIDGQKGLALANERKLVEGNDPSVFIPVIQTLVPKLMRAAKPGSDLTSAPDSAPSTPAGGLEASQTASESPSGHPTGAYLLLGTGAALLAGSLVAGLMASGKASSYRSDIKSGLADAAKSDQSSANTLALVSTVALGAGIASVGAGGIWFFTSGSSSEAQR